MKEIEIRVRPVVRYIVTRHTRTYISSGPCEIPPGSVACENPNGSEQLGEFPNAKQANRVACALHGYEHECMTVDSEGKPSAEVKLTLADD